MDAEGKFWIAIWRLIAGVVVVMTLSISGRIIYENEQRADLIRSGLSPVEVDCALGGAGASYSHAAICAVLATKGK